MRHIKSILRLHFAGGIDSRRNIARAVGVSKTAVADCLKRAAAAGMSTWAAVEPLDEDALERRLYPACAPSRATRARPVPDWAAVRAELARRDHKVTLALLWTEYKAQHPDGYQYAQFTELYRRFEKKLSLVLRQHHRGGEKCFVDFCDGMKLTDPLSGERIPTELFVAALGASSYTFACATRGQTIPEWLDCHVRMYQPKTAKCTELWLQARWLKHDLSQRLAACGGWWSPALAALPRAGGRPVPGTAGTRNPNYNHTLGS
ncbi:MAG: hypothetical protein M0Z84_08830 [Gammaproteobacteria bacterium]|nr:hypothetical protein [Gammaproteobacteria bacterium]